MKVSDIMTQAIVTDAAEDTVAQAAVKMREQQTGSLLIMDSDRLLGIFTERDLVKSVATGQDPNSVRLKDIMTTDIVTISPNMTLHEAAEVMAAKWIRHLPVVQDDKVLGMVSQRDLAGYLAQLLNEPEAQSLSETELVRSRRLKRIKAGDLD